MATTENEKTVLENQEDNQPAQTSQATAAADAGVQESKPAYDYKDLSQEAPNSFDVKPNDYFDEVDKLDEENAEPVYELHLPEQALTVVCNALAAQIQESWMFSAEYSIDDDVRASHQVLKLLKELNAKLPDEKKMGCIVEQLLPFSGGDVYIDATYRLMTPEMGSVIAIACFDYERRTIAFRLFNPAKYPNARTLHDCLGDKVPLSSIQSIEEVESLTEEEKERFSLAIRTAWVDYY